MTQQYSNITNKLVELISVLDKYQEKNWSNYFRHVLDQVQNKDRQGIVSLTQMNQGIGSFNDLVICKLNGHQINQADEDRVNTKLNQLFTSIIASAQKIRIAE